MHTLVDGQESDEMFKFPSSEPAQLPPLPGSIDVATADESSSTAHSLDVEHDIA